MISKAQLDRLKASIDILEVAERYTTLRKASVHEWKGLCPRCPVGDDRFHVHADGWWFCRHCHKQRADVIDLVRFAEGLSFAAACAQLGAEMGTRPPSKAHPERLPPRPRIAPQQWATELWQAEAWSAVNAAVQRIDHNDGEPGRQYLQRRGIGEATWQAWQLGYDPVGRAIVLPWLLPDGRLTAIKYRKIYKSRSRFWTFDGSQQTLFGTQLLTRTAQILVLVEGELNAISLWQACRHLGINVVSFGSESGGRAIKAAGRLARAFPHVVVWCDKADRARAIRKEIGSHGIAIQSPTGLDANDLLQSNVLGQFVEGVLQNHELITPNTLAVIPQPRGDEYREINLAFVQERLHARDERAVQVHCAIRRANFEDVVRDVLSPENPSGLA